MANYKKNTKQYNVPRRPKPPKTDRTAENSETRAETIQWFPGHMARTRRKIQESLSQVDAVIEIVDARIPLSSRNPELDHWVGRKPRLIVLTKADLADEMATKHWIAYFESRGIAAIAVDCKSGRGFNGFMPSLRRVLCDLIEKWESKGMNHAIRAMIVGIPNVGKSSFLDSFVPTTASATPVMLLKDSRSSNVSFLTAVFRNSISSMMMTPTLNIVHSLAAYSSLSLRRFSFFIIG